MEFITLRTFLHEGVKVQEMIRNHGDQVELVWCGWPFRSTKLNYNGNPLFREVVPTSDGMTAKDLYGCFDAARLSLEDQFNRFHSIGYETHPIMHIQKKGKKTAAKKGKKSSKKKVKK